MLSSGYVLDENEIVSFRDNGAFSSVYEAKKVSGKDIFALKIYKKSKGDQNKKRFFEENKILKILSPHDNIIKPLSEIISTKYLYYLMELADFNLEKYVYSFDTSFEDKILVFLGICEGLKHSHSKGIIHRDLWWNNVLILKNRGGITPKLSDFGRAKNFDGKEISDFPTEIWGRMIVCPPEHHFHLWKEADKNKYLLGDIYALGILLFYMIQGLPLHYSTILFDDIKRFLGQNDIKIEELSFDDRMKAYKKWLLKRKSDQNVNSRLLVNLPIKEREESVNSLIGNMCDSDYSKRIFSVDEVMKRVSEIN
jgi:serine/threonine protein kinase